MPTDIDLWKAAQKSLAEFTKLYDPNNSNPIQTGKMYGQYKATSKADIEAKANTSNSNSGSNNSPNKFQKIGGGILGMGADLFAAGETTTLQGLDADKVKVQDLKDLILDRNNNIKNTGDIVSGILKTAVNGIGNYYKQQAGLLNDINKAGGLTGQISEDYRKTLTDTNVELLKYGIHFDELGRAATDILQKSGRFLIFNQESFAEFAKTGQAYMGSLEAFTNLIPEFEKVGYGAVSASREIGIIGQRTLSLGLNTQKVTQEVGANLSKLNSYGFKDGIQGLGDMVRKSIEFRSSLQGVLDIADKVMDPQGALEFSAKLQVIGGAIGDFGDPLKLMYMATNNVEGLQEAFIKAAGSLATYNAQQGKFEINSLNIRRVRDMAKETGMSIDDLTKSAIAFQERSKAKTDLLGLGSGVNKDQKEFLTNLARMEGGKMTIDLTGTKLQDQLIQGNKIALSDLSNNPEILKVLLNNQEQLKDMSPQDIIKNQATNVQQIMRYVEFLAANARLQGGKGVSEIANLFGINSSLANKVTESLKTMGEDSKGMADKVMNLITGHGIDAKKTTGVKPKSVNAGTNQQTLTNSMNGGNNTTAQNNNTNNGTQQIEHTVNIKVPALLDDMGRGIAKDSSFLTNLTSRNARLYTNNAIKTN